NGVNGGTALAQSPPSKSPRCARNWLVIQNHLLNPTYWESQLTSNFPAAHPRAARHRNPAKPQSPASHRNRRDSARRCSRRLSEFEFRRGLMAPRLGARSVDKDLLLKAVSITR